MSKHGDYLKPKRNKLMNKNKVVVIGGSGFLGSHVADHLSDNGYQVYIYDVKASNYLRHDQVFIEGNILDRDALQKALTGMDYVYNFSAIADIDEADCNAHKSAEINILGNINVLDACVACNVKKIIYASSIYVYSNHGSFYRITKQTSERFIEEYFAQHGLSYVILRYGSLYGRRSDMRNGIYRYLYQALHHKGRIIYHGSRDAVREYIHVADAAKLSLNILDEQYNNRALILTGTEKYSIESLMAMISEMLPYQLNVEYKNDEFNVHYNLTPYKFHPEVGHKLILNDFIDMGQGLLDTMHEIHGCDNHKTEKVDA